MGSMGGHHVDMRITRVYRWACLTVLWLMGVQVGVRGEVEFFQAKPTELESMNTLRDLKSIKPVTGGEILKPQMYLKPPEIVEGTVAGNPDAKLYYFCKYHSTGEIVNLLTNQFLAGLNDAEGKPLPGVPYNISQNPATEQIIVACPNRRYAEQVLAFLEQVDVPPLQVHIDCLVSEVYADHTMDWQTQLDIQNLFGGQVELTGLMPGAALRDAARNTFGLEGGYIRQADQPGHLFSALVDMLVSRGYLKILMNPSLDVVNGKTATIRTIDQPPLDTVSRVNSNTGEIAFRREYANIVDSLEITPTVFPDGTISVRTKVTIGSKSTPEGVAQNPIVTQRQVYIEENRVRSGQSLVIGGIRKTEQRSVVRGVPLLKDIPFVGFLFSAKDFEERGKEVVFIITPTISSGGIPNEQLVADLEAKHNPSYEPTLLDAITDPLGGQAYTGLVEKEATQAEVRRLRAEMAKARAEQKIRELNEKLRKAREEILSGRQQSEAARRTTEAIQKELEAAKAAAAAAEAEKAKIAAEAQKAQAAIAEAERLKQQAEAEKAAAEKAKKDVETEIAAWMKAARQKQQGGQAPPEKPAETGQEPPAGPPAPPGTPSGTSKPPANLTEDTKSPPAQPPPKS